MVEGTSNFFLLFVFISLTAMICYKLRLLTISGSIAAWLVGLSTSIGLGTNGLILLGIFFSTSSLWSKYKGKQKNSIEERHEKGSQRDWQQVFANGGVAAVSSLLYALTQDFAWVPVFCISIAVSNADTWASEIGTLSTRSPFSVRTLRICESGTSGAISLLGSVASLSGSMLISFSSIFLFQLSLFNAFIITFLGFIGSFVDTFLGAYLQVVYQCRDCGTETEKRQHCGGRTDLVRGFPKMNNDSVNFFSNIITVAIGFLIFKN